MAVNEHVVLAGLELGLYFLLLGPTLLQTIAFFPIGQTGWIYLMVFVLAKIAGAALLISVNTQAAAVSIGLQVAVQVLYQIALGPLLSCVLSFVNVATPGDTSASHPGRRRLYSGNFSGRLRLAHLLILAGLILGIVGGVDRAPKSSSAQASSADYDTGATLLKVSAFFFLGAVLAISLGVLSLWNQRNGLPRRMRLVVNAAALALPLILVRLVYSLVSSFNLDTTTSGSHSTAFNMTTGSWPIYLFMVLIPQVIIVGIFNVYGILACTRAEDKPEITSKIQSASFQTDKQVKMSQDLIV